MNIATSAQEAIILAQRQLLEWYEAEMFLERGSNWRQSTTFLSLCNTLLEAKMRLREMQ